MNVHPNMPRSAQNSIATSSFKPAANTVGGTLAPSRSSTSVLYRSAAAADLAATGTTAQFNTVCIFLRCVAARPLEHASPWYLRLAADCGQEAGGRCRQGWSKHGFASFGKRDRARAPQMMQLAATTQCCCVKAYFAWALPQPVTMLRCLTAAVWHWHSTVVLSISPVVRASLSKPKCGSWPLCLS